MPKGERKYTATVMAKKMATLAAGQEVSPLKAGREQEADSEDQEPKRQKKKHVWVRRVR